MSVDKLQPKALSHLDGQPNIPNLPDREADKVVLGIQEGMIKLMEYLRSSPVVTDDDKEKFSSIASNFASFVGENLGAAPGESVKKEEPSGMDKVSPEAGIAKVVPVL